MAGFDGDDLFPIVAGGRGILCGALIGLGWGDCVALPQQESEVSIVVNFVAPRGPAKVKQRAIGWTGDVCKGSGEGRIVPRLAQDLISPDNELLQVRGTQQRIQQKLEPYAPQLALLQEIPGVDRILAAVIIAELGVDMTVFKSVAHLASWAGVCPGNNESAGKRKSSRIPKGNVYLKTALVEAANAAARARGTYLRDKFYRLKARRGCKRAAVAIAHKILVSIYYMFSQNVSYNDLGDLYLDKLNTHQVTRNLIRRLERLGYVVTITASKAPQAPPRRS
jgi:hypothetical protein